MRYSLKEAVEFCAKNGYTHLSKDVEGNFWAIAHNEYLPRKIFQNYTSFREVHVTVTIDGITIRRYGIRHTSVIVDDPYIGIDDIVAARERLSQWDYDSFTRIDDLIKAGLTLGTISNRRFPSIDRLLPSSESITEDESFKEIERYFREISYLFRDSYTRFQIKAFTEKHSITQSQLLEFLRDKRVHVKHGTFCYNKNSKLCTNQSINLTK